MPPCVLADSHANAALRAQFRRVEHHRPGDSGASFAADPDLSVTGVDLVAAVYEVRPARALEDVGPAQAVDLVATTTGVDVVRLIIAGQDVVVRAAVQVLDVRGQVDLVRVCPMMPSFCTPSSEMP